MGGSPAPWMGVICQIKGDSYKGRSVWMEVPEKPTRSNNGVHSEHDWKWIKACRLKDYPDPERVKQNRIYGHILKKLYYKDTVIIINLKIILIQVSKQKKSVGLQRNNRGTPANPGQCNIQEDNGVALVFFSLHYTLIFHLPFHSSFKYQCKSHTECIEIIHWNYIKFYISCSIML